MYFLVMAIFLVPNFGTEFWVEKGSVSTIFHGSVTFMLVSSKNLETKNGTEKPKVSPQPTSGNDVWEGLSNDLDEQNNKNVRRPTISLPTKVALKISTPAEGGDFNATLGLGERSHFTLGNVTYVVVLLEIKKDKARLLVIPSNKKLP